jgi:undecaprenyl-diphosphatase
MTAPRRNQDGGVDPTLETASSRGWRTWAAQLGQYEQERIVGFGGAVALGFLLAVVSLYAFLKLADEVMGQETAALDAAVTAYAQRFSSPQLTVVMQVISLMGSEVIWILGVILLVLFIWQRRWGAGFMLVLVTGGAQVLNDILKALFHRTRPVPIIAGLLGAQQYSFPSGHAMMSSAFYFYLAYLCWRLVDGWKRIALVVGLAVLVLLIGVSRIYLQAHYLSDVIAGYLAGFLWSDTVIIGSRLLVPRVRRHHAPRTVST